jgi:hypothetical protein
MHVEDPVNRRDGLKLGPAFLSRWILAGMSQNPLFEMASKQPNRSLLHRKMCITAQKTMHSNMPKK